jgi:hypothetical protein
MKLEKAIKKYYSIKLENLNSPEVSVLNFKKEMRLARKQISRADFLLNIFVHAVIILIFIFTFNSGRRNSEFSEFLGKRAGDIELNRHLNNGLITLSKYFKTLQKINY